MTEADWLTSTDPQAMLERLCGWNWPKDMRHAAHTVLTDRKLRLFAVACCEHAGMTVLDEGNTLVRLLSQSAAGLAHNWTPPDANASRPTQLVKADLLRCIFGNPFRPVPGLQCAKYQGGVWHETADWLTPAVLAIARTIHDDRRWDDLPILADALEEAGCDSANILAHLRGMRLCADCLGSGKIDTGGFTQWDEPIYMPCDCNAGYWPESGPHARGCWALDLIMGKE